MTARQGLLEAAARCYLRAGDQDGACHCFDLLGAWAEAARLHESAGRTREAAARYEQAGSHLDAARCHRASGDLAGEARCLLRGGEALRAAWVLVHDLGRAREAREVAGAIGQGDGLGQGLVLARCSAAQGDRASAARALHQAIPALRGLPAGPARRRFSTWALALAEVLRRPDLGAVIITTLEEGAGIEPLWDAWAQRTFGAAVAPPVTMEASPAAQESESA